ncbi:MAG: DNA polymerase III subunit gamma/tau [Prevotellaceae bacterium]|nr:DNA polymerase III subunit gamma/tau [Candidatus Minthosoma equi]
MDNYIVSARKYRPVTFDSVVGQNSLTVTLKNAIKSGRLAHAYLFCGPRGVGKTTCARIFAKTINCLSPLENGEACGECESCKAFNEQRSYNIHELDAASNNSVEDIRALIDQVRIPPQIGAYKVFIIDEVHMLSQAAFNAFLKTLEEPPHHAIFILATTEKHKLLPTILSRCQIYDFSRMSVDNIVRHLKNVAEKEGITAEESALNVIAQKADGGMRDALSIFDQVASFCGGNITYQRTIENLNVLDSDYYFRLTDYFLQAKITECMLTFNEILSKGFEGQHFITGLSSHFRNLLVSRDAQTVSLIEASEEVRNKYKEQAQKCKPQFLFQAMKLANDCDLNYKQSQNKRLLVELTLIEMAQLSSDETPSSGRGPKRILKPIFAQLKAAGNGGQIASNQAAPAVVPNGTAASAPASTPAAENRPTASAAMPASSPIATQKSSVAPTLNRVTSFSIRQNTSASAQQTKPAVTQPVQTQAEQIATFTNKEVKDTELVVAWREYAQSLKSTEVALSIQFDNMEPKLSEDKSSFLILADNPIIMEDLKRHMNKILAYLHQRLQNNALKMEVRLSEIEERKKILTKTEQLNLLLERSDALRKLQSELQLELIR